jgi:hypothetical protein
MRIGEEEVLLKDMLTASDEVTDFLLRHACDLETDLNCGCDKCSAYKKACEVDDFLHALKGVLK